MRDKTLHTIAIAGLVFATFALTATPAHAASQNCAASHGTVIDIEIPTTILSQTIDAKVYLPACYEESNQRYPVLYLLHGMDNNASQWVTLAAPQAADAMPVQFIIVMPHDRMEVSFNTAFVNEVVPFVDENFRTIDDHNYRAIGGLSYGGGWAIHIGLSHPELFSRIGGHSPALFYGDAPNLEFWAMHLPLGIAINIDIGEGDPLLENSAQPIDSLLTEAGAQHIVNIYGGGHTEAYWASHITEYLSFYTTGW